MRFCWSCAERPFQKRRGQSKSISFIAERAATAPPCIEEWDISQEGTNSGDRCITRMHVEANRNLRSIADASRQRTHVGEA